MKSVTCMSILLALFLCCVQIVKPISYSVRAYKKDQKDKTPVKVVITNSKNKEISHSTFTKNTGGFVRKLHFDINPNEQTDFNKVRVYQGQKVSPEITVTLQDIQNTEKQLAIDKDSSLTPTVALEEPQVPVMHSSSQKKDTATMKIDIETQFKDYEHRTLTLVSYATQLGSIDAAFENKRSKERLDKINYSPEFYYAPGRPKLKIYKNVPTYVYAFIKKGNVEQAKRVTEITPNQLLEAGKHIKLVVHDEGSVTIGRQELIHPLGSEFMGGVFSLHQ